MVTFVALMTVVLHAQRAQYQEHLYEDTGNRSCRILPVQSSGPAGHCLPVTQTRLLTERQEKNKSIVSCARHRVLYCELVNSVAVSPLHSLPDLCSVSVPSGQLSLPIRLAAGARSGCDIADMVSAHRTLNTVPVHRCLHPDALKSIGDILKDFCSLVFADWWFWSGVLPFVE